MDAGTHWLIHGLPDALARALILALARKEASASIAEALPADARHVILGGATGNNVTARHTAALMAARDLAAAFTARGGHLVILAGEQDGLPALARTAALEWPLATVRSIAMDAADAEILAAEILCPDAPRDVRYAEGQRLTPNLSAAAFNPVPGTIREGDVLLVTGGARGVTADCVIALAARTGAHFVLAGRSPLTPLPADLPRTSSLADMRAALIAQARTRGDRPDPRAIDAAARAHLASLEVEATRAAIHKSGARATYVAADISTAVGAAQTLAAARTLPGRLTGLIHGAGVLADKRIADKTPEQIARVFAPKVEGLAHLLSLMSPDELRHIALFSSAAAHYGNAGQSDYAMANEWLNAIARRLKADDDSRTVVSFNWGPWDGGMVDASLANHFAAQGIALISRDGGAALFADAMLCGAAAPVALCVGDAMGHGL